MQARENLAAVRVRPAPNAAASTPTIGTVRNVVILLRFANHLNRVLPANADYEVLFNAVGGDPVLAPTGSVRDVYLENSYGQLSINSTIFGWIDLPQTEQYYANNSAGTDETIWEAITDALNAADPFIDFAQFDEDNDGWADVITFIHSGYGAEWGGVDADGAELYERIWSHRWSIPTWTSAEGVQVSDYHISPGLWDTGGAEIGHIGVIAHETGHFFGLPDLYDIDGGGEGAGSYELMANSWGFDFSQLYPPHMSGWSKLQLGWVTPTEITAPGTYVVQQAESNPAFFRIAGGFPPGEYLLVENRQPVSFDGVMPQGGLCIWHIDEAKEYQTDEGWPGQSGWPGNNNHYKVALLQADGLYQLELGHGEWDYPRGDAGDVYHGDGVDELSGTTLPGTHAYQNGSFTPTGHRVRNVSTSGPTITFEYDIYVSGPGACCDSSVSACTENTSFEDCVLSGAGQFLESATCPEYAPPCGWAPCCLCTQSAACPWSGCELARFTDAQPSPYAHFGDSVAMSGDVAIVGAEHDDVAGVLTGSAFVFRRRGMYWFQEAMLTASDGAVGDYFGQAVDIRGDLAVVGAPLNKYACAQSFGCEPGSAYVFRREGNSWVQEAALRNPEPDGSTDRFGESVAIGGNVIVVGAPNGGSVSPLETSQYGAAYIYRREGTSWQLEAILHPREKPDDNNPPYLFGISVSVQGDTLIVGAASEFTQYFPERGAAYIYRDSGGSWTLEDVIYAADAQSFGYERFGTDVHVSADTAVIGAPWDDDACVDQPRCASGSAYVFQRQGGAWLQTAKLTASDATAGVYFGESVAIEDGLILVGGDGTSGAYLFRHDTGNWIEVAKLSSSVADLGQSVAISGNIAIVGAPSTTHSGVLYAGAAFVFPISGDCNGNGTLDTCDILAGAAEDPDGNGILDECFCQAADAPVQPPAPMPINRLVRFVAPTGTTGHRTALRLTLSNLPASYDVHNGVTLWVGPARPVSELSGSDGDTPPAFWAATLQCEPHFAFWDVFGTLYVYHELIIPSATYTVQAIDESCWLSGQSSYSPALELRTAKWGDCCSPFAGGRWPGPDSWVEVTVDVVATLEKFRNTSTAPIKGCVDLEPAMVDFKITISDVTRTLDAFRSLPYPFPPPLNPPCP